MTRRTGAHQAYLIDLLSAFYYLILKWKGFRDFSGIGDLHAVLDIPERGIPEIKALFENLINASKPFVLFLRRSAVSHGATPKGHTQSYLCVHSLGYYT